MTSEIIQATDGAKVAARLYAPDGPARGSVVIGGAMGVRQDFYAPFAQWLAGQGWRVATFDYRGSGESAPPGKSLRGFEADLFDWARDYDAVIARAHAALPDRPLYLIGHSLGAQLPGLLGNQHQVSGMLSVAAGSGYWRENAPRLKRYVLYFWFVLVPLATALFGYFPGRRLRKIGDLPAGVVMQWRRWCLNPRYSVGAEGEGVRQRYANARFPVHALSIVDDELMTLRGTHSLVDLYENAPSEIRRIGPAELGVRRVGHFGPFRSECEATLWPRMEQWLQALSTPAAA
jgi:predicted alpha/beta hydrolase